MGKTGTRSGPRTYSRVVPGVPGRVLVVDDNKVIRQLIRVNLELEGFEVVTAADGAECLDVVHQVQPDVITLDVVMPRLDGLRTAALLRADARTRKLPIVVVSACTQYEVESGLEVGVDAFLAKPFEPSELVTVVRQLVGRELSGDSEGSGGAEEVGEVDRCHVAHADAGGGDAQPRGCGLEFGPSSLGDCSVDGGAGAGDGGGDDTGVPGDAEPAARPGG